MISLVNTTHDLIDTIAAIADRSQLQYHEYKGFKDEELKRFFINKTLKNLNSTDAVSIVALSNTQIKGFISIYKDAFDSEIFGFNCYRVVDLMVFSLDFSEVDLIISNLINAVENAISSKSNRNYILYSLNNNTYNADLLFNTIIKSGFYYIHTLLTFSSHGYNQEIVSNYPDQNLIIRSAKKDDALKVSDLADKAFQYSRFFMDPYLDKEKSKQLLKISAMNSILKGFVDIMFVAEINKEVVGYYCGKKKEIKELNKTIGEATISVVDPRYRGLGLFTKLDDHLLKWFSDNADFAEMGTYLANFPVHKTWISKNLGLIRGSHQFSRFLGKLSHE